MKYINTDKIEQVKIANDNYYVVLDFDKTITSKESLDSWMALLDFEIYGEACKKEIEELNTKYSPMELDYTLEEVIKEKYMVEWYQKSMDLLYKYQISYSNLVKALEKNTITFRKGGKEFLQDLYQEKVPVIILSAGIGNVIEEFLKKQQCYYENIHIVSNFLTFKEDKMQKFTDPIIHSMNKRIEKVLPEELQKNIQKKQYAILCGDIIEDIQMIPEQNLDKTITIGFLNKIIEQNLEFYNRHYDMVLTDKEACFQEVKKIIKRERTDG